MASYQVAVELHIFQLDLTSKRSDFEVFLGYVEYVLPECLLHGEAIYYLGHVAGVDVAVYGEYSVGSGRPDKAETKLLLERNTRSFDARLNLIAEKPLASGELVELAYAASFDVPAARNFRVGVAAFGELGTFRNFAPREEHYAGPIIKTVIEKLGGHTLKIEAGYLFALGEARDKARGLARLIAELEF